jgi:outer membrane protein assembly factor BamB
LYKVKLKKTNFRITNYNGGKKIKKQMLILILTLTLGILLCNTVSATGLADSPQPKFQHDNNNTGQSEYTGPQTNGTKWKYEGQISRYPVIGSDGTIYTAIRASEGNYLCALNPNGTQKWNYTLIDFGYVSTAAAIDSDGTIYFGTSGSSDYYLFYALNPNGTQKWNYSVGEIMQSSPAIGSDGTIYFGCRSGVFYALNPNGTQKWNYTTEYDIRSAPAIGNDGTIYFQSGRPGSETYGGNFYALNPNGTLKWKYYTGSYGAISPAIGSDGTIYIDGESRSGLFYALNPNGTQKWNYTFGGFLETYPAIGSDGTIYCVCYDLQSPTNSYLVALNPNGTLKWKYATSATSNLVIDASGNIYFGDGRALKSLNPNGTLKWNYQPYSYPDIIHFISFIGVAIGSDGTLYASSESQSAFTVGNLYAIADIVVSASVKGDLYNSPVMVNLTTNYPGQIYYYTSEGSIPTKYTAPIPITSTTTLKYFALDDSFNPSPIYTQTYTMDKTPTKVTLMDVIANKGQNVVLNATIWDTYHNKTITGQNITFKVNGAVIGSAFSDTNGVATLNYLDLTGGNFTVSAEFKGDNQYANSTANIHAIGEKIFTLTVKNTGTGRIRAVYYVTVYRPGIVAPILKKYSFYLNAGQSTNFNVGTYAVGTSVSTDEYVYNVASSKRKVSLVNTWTATGLTPYVQYFAAANVPVSSSKGVIAKYRFWINRNALGVLIVRPPSLL